MILKLIEDKSTESIAAFIAIRVAVILGCWLIMVIGTLIDFWSGTSTARALGEKLDSKGFRRTIRKDADYMQVMLFLLLFDTLGICFLHFYILPFATIIGTIAVLAIEGRSVIENNRRKKAHAAEIPETILKIVKANNVKQAKEILEYLADPKAVDS